MLNKYILAAIVVGVLLIVGVTYWWYRKGSDDSGGNHPEPPPPDPPVKSEVFAIATWDNDINNYSRKWAPDYNVARQRAITTVNLPIATYDQITDAWRNGFAVCNWGWIQPNPNFDIVLPNQGTGGVDCGGGAPGLLTQKVSPPASNTSCIFVYGPKPKFNADANNPKSPLYRGYVILPFEFGRPRNKWSQWD